MTESGLVKIKTRVIDSRGLYRDTEYYIDVYSYSTPSIVCNDIYRCNSDGTRNEDGTNVAIDFTKTYSSINNLNMGYAKVKFKKYNQTEYSELIQLTKSPFILTDNFEKESSYDFVLQINDLITVTPIEINHALPSAAIPFNIKKGGKGAAFGCYAENDNELTVGYNLNVKGMLNYTDLSSSVIYDKYVTKKEMSVKRFDSLGITHLKAKLYVKEKIPANTWTTLAGIKDLKLQQLCPASTTIDYYTTDRIIAGIININGLIKVISSNGFEVGEMIYINTVFS